MKSPLLNEEQNYFDNQMTKNVVMQNRSETFKKSCQLLQGELKIKQIIYLQRNNLKGFILFMLLTISVIGLFLYKYFKKLRAFVFYNTLQYPSTQLTHVFVRGDEGSQEISPVYRVIYHQQQYLMFEFKKLRYLIDGKRWIPLCIDYHRQIQRSIKQNKFVCLKTKQAKENQYFFGKNQHRVEVPTYLAFMFDTMTQPFFIFQYLVSIIYALQNVAVFAILMIVFGFVTTSVNYFLLRRSYNKIKETAQKKFKVKVLREENVIQIDNIQLVPGDIFIPSSQIPCDSIVVNGEMFVDQANLTGEDVPIAKFNIKDISKINQKSHWLFEGSKIQTMREGTLAMAVNVGYGSCRGRIIRKILTKNISQPQCFLKLVYFQTQVLIVSVIVYLATLSQLWQFQIDGIMKVFRLFDFITYSFPAPFPIFFNLAYSFCLVRITKQGMIGTKPQKTIQSSRMKTICFDKTGTLTKNAMKIQKIYTEQNGDMKDIIKQLFSFRNIQNLFATCHSVQYINNLPRGDQIDLRMFLYTQAKIRNSKKQGVIRQIQLNQRILELLRIDQYQSQFQSMSVVVRDTSNDKIYVYVKGSPQKIQKNAFRKIKYLQQFVKKMSFLGYRSIGFAYKQINQRQLSHYLKTQRDSLLQGTQVLGVTTFSNQLKYDASSTISKLVQAQIISKIITGDNIFLGVQTALKTNIISQQQTIIIVQGSKYNKNDNSCQLLKLVKQKNGQFRQQIIKMASVNFQEKKGTVYAIDNQFIEKFGDNFLHNNIKVFARISPQNKALIVRKHRQIQQQKLKNRSRWQKIIGQCSYRVGMVGDGANDLIAIKQADVGIAISSSDAVYSASFAVCELSQIPIIISQSKNVQRQIIEMTKYYGLTQFISIIVTLILATDCSYFTSIQLIYKSFANTLLITLMLGFSHPSKKMTSFMPASNFMNLQNHLVYWGNLAIITIGLIVSYKYFQSTDDFVPNTTHRYVHFPEGWYGETQSSTLNFITSNIVYIFLPICLYRSSPWKKPIVTNYPLAILIILNIVLITGISFLTGQLGMLGLKQIGIGYIFVVWGIMTVTILVLWAYNLILQKMIFKSFVNRHHNLSEQSNQSQEL